MERRCPVCGRELDLGEACYHPEKTEPEFWISSHLLGEGKSVLRRKEEPSTAAQREKDMEKLVAAYNATYGAGINPEAVKDMLEALKAIVDCNKCENGWISNACISSADAAIEKAKL